jgi:hypothetical protein
VFTPVKQPRNGRDLDTNSRTYNTLLRQLRCLGERGFALLVGRWHALRRLTTSPRKIGDCRPGADADTPQPDGWHRTGTTPSETGVPDNRGRPEG